LRKKPANHPTSIRSLADARGINHIHAQMPERIPTHRVIWGPGSRGVGVLEDLVKILVIEDDQAIQGIVEDALTDGGFDVAIAASGEEAVTLLKGSDQGTYRALVTDIGLRGRIDGWEVAKQAREIDPAFPIIYMTGAAADQWPSHGVPNSILLTKPFAPAQLIAAVAQLLNAGSTPPT
jgi:CheY-like chemotaxis protein